MGVSIWARFGFYVISIRGFILFLFLVSISFGFIRVLSGFGLARMLVSMCVLFGFHVGSILGFYLGCIWLLFGVYLASTRYSILVLFGFYLGLILGFIWGFKLRFLYVRGWSYVGFNWLVLVFDVVFIWGSICVLIWF